MAHAPDRKNEPCCRRIASQLWLSHLGSVTVGVRLPGREDEVEASGSLAQVSALLFAADAASRDSPSAWRVGSEEAHTGLSSAALAAQMALPPAEAERLLEFWAKRGVLQRSDQHVGVFVPRTYNSAADSAAAASASAAAAKEEDEEEEDIVGAAVRQQLEQMVRNFAVGMLRSHGSLTFDKIESMLRSFGSCEMRCSGALLRRVLHVSMIS